MTFESLIRFKRMVLDLLPLFYLLTLSIFIIAYNRLPAPSGELKYPRIVDIANFVCLFAAFFITLMIPRYDRWVLAPLVESSRELRELLLHWLVEPLLAVQVCVLGLIPSLAARSWTFMIPYVMISYATLIVSSLRLRKHFEVIDRRLKRAGVRL